MSTLQVFSKSKSVGQEVKKSTEKNRQNVFIIDYITIRYKKNKKVAFNNVIFVEVYARDHF